MLILIISDSKFILFMYFVSLIILDSKNKKKSVNNYCLNNTITFLSRCDVSCRWSNKVLLQTLIIDGWLFMQFEYDFDVLFQVLQGWDVHVLPLPPRPGQGLLHHCQCKLLKSSQDAIQQLVNNLVEILTSLTRLRLPAKICK